MKWKKVICLSQWIQYAAKQIILYSKKYIIGIRGIRKMS